MGEKVQKVVDIEKSENIPVFIDYSGMSIGTKHILT
ncbi:hypothetical protein DFR42_101555 [Undibacterium pigrum]|uniref:Uncharacterized protein n=1 Tax=Undibacterium pigrum TaxID=401470 RepID=A0A318JHV9_9BURK|nr:hypothetical protein DFR42_101555 [Undibacterium pigrum]